MKKILCGLLVLLACAAQAENIPVNGQTLSPKTVNFMIHYPAGYDPNRAEGYPVLFFLHGKGQRDTGGLANREDGTLDLSILGRVLTFGPPRLIEDGRWDESLPLIVVSPQSQTKSGGFSSNNFDPLFNYIVDHLNVDRSRLYLTGLSQGAYSTYNLYKTGAYHFAAIVPVSGWLSTTIDDCAAIHDVAVWAFHGDMDRTVGFNAGVAAFRQVADCAPSQPAKFTAYAGVDHNAWTRTYDNSMAGAYDIDDPSVDATANIGGDGLYYKQDLYHWLLSFPSSLPVPNEPPSADAGSDRTITLPSDSVTLAGSGSDSDGTVVGFGWAQTGGPSTATLTGADTATPTASGLIEGRYTFALTVTDDDGASATDTVDVVVQPEIVPPTPGSFLKLANSGYGHVFLQYHYGQGNSSASRVDVLALGHDTVRFHLRHIAGDIDYGQLIFGLMASFQTRELQIAPYITAVGSDWVEVSIPLVDFGFDAGKLEGGIYQAKLRAIAALGSGEFGFDELVFTGGSTPFVYYGDAYPASGLEGYSVSGSGFEVVARPDSGGVDLGNAAPEIAPIADINLREGGTSSIDISASDADGDAVSLSLQPLPAFAAFTDHGDGTGQLQLAPATGDAGSYALQVQARDSAGASTQADVMLSVQPAGASAGFLKIGNSGWGHIFLQYHAGQTNSPAARVDVLSLGHDTVEFQIRDIAGDVDYRQLRIALTASFQTRELAIGPYVDSVGASWTTVSIPLADFGFDAGKLEGGIFDLSLHATSALGAGEFGIDEIAFVGGTVPFVWYGDAYPDSAQAGYSVSGNGFTIVDRPSSGGL